MEEVLITTAENEDFEVRPNRRRELKKIVKLPQSSESVDENANIGEPKGPNLRDKEKQPEILGLVDEFDGLGQRIRATIDPKNANKEHINDVYPRVKYNASLEPLKFTIKEGSKGQMKGKIEITNVSNCYITYKLFSSSPQRFEKMEASKLMNYLAPGKTKIINIIEKELEDLTIENHKFYNEKYALCAFPVYEYNEVLNVERNKLEIFWKSFGTQLVPPELVETYEFTFGEDIGLLHLIAKSPTWLPQIPIVKECKVIFNAADQDCGDTDKAFLRNEFLKIWVAVEGHHPYVARRQLANWWKIHSMLSKKVGQLTRQINISLSLLVIICFNAGLFYICTNVEAVDPFGWRTVRPPKTLTWFQYFCSFLPWW